jgi:outer membrane protein TolC
VGIVSIPLGNTTARKNVTKSRIELRRANSQVTRLRQDIIVSVRRAARGLLAAAQGVQAAERRRVAAAEQLRAETIRLEHGESTPFDVLQRDRDLVEAESQKIEALRAYRISQATLEREQGTILEDRNISIEQVRRLTLH